VNIFGEKCGLKAPGHTATGFCAGSQNCCPDAAIPVTRRGGAAFLPAGNITAIAIELSTAFH
jgi:hypothetical protein